MSRYEVRYVGDWISYIYDNEIKEAVKISNEDFVGLLNKQEEQIADLEAKLAEMEQENRDLHTSINLSIPNQIAMRDEIERLHTCIDDRIAELVKENAELKQQLAEKEKLIDEYADSVSKVLIEKANLSCRQDRDKILFAVEQLENVRNEIHGICFFTCDFKCDEIMLEQSDEIIDNQIEELKKEMK